MNRCRSSPLHAADRASAPQEARRSGAAEHGLIRVIDESGEDYLYPVACFAAIELPEAVAEALALAS